MQENFLYHTKMWKFSVSHSLCDEVRVNIGIHVSKTKHNSFKDTTNFTLRYMWSLQKNRVTYVLYGRYLSYSIIHTKHSILVSCAVERAKLLPRKPHKVNIKVCVSDCCNDTIRLTQIHFMFTYSMLFARPEVDKSFK